MTTQHEPAETSLGCARDANVGSTERIVSALCGAGLIAGGLSRRNLLAPLAGAALLYRGWSGRCAVYRALGISTACDDANEGGVKARYGERAEISIHIERQRDELYRYWKDLRNLPQVMSHLDSVTPLDQQRSHWVACGPMNVRLEWDAEIINDLEGEVIAWQSLPGSQVDTAGSVRFQTGPNGEGTDLTVELKYDPPGGQIAAMLGRLFGQGLEQTVREDLRAFKQMMEAGELATAAVHGNGSAEL